MKARGIGAAADRRACGLGVTFGGPLRLFVALAVLIALWLSPGLGRRACAESGAAHSWNGAGLKVDVDTRWLDGGGYRPVQITVTPVAPVTADRTLTVEFSARRFENYRRDDLRVVQDVEIPAGSALVRTTMSVPHAAAWNEYTINLLEDGRLRTTFGRRGGNPGSWQGVRAEGLPRLLVVGDKLPDTSVAACLYDTQIDYGARSGRTAPGGREPLPTAIARPTSELPVRWIDYTNLDLVCLSIEQFKTLRRNQPERLRALVEWTSAGGNLCVYGVGRDWERLGELESLAGLPPGSDSEVRDPQKRGWTKPARKLFGKPILGAGSTTSPSLIAEMEAYALAVSDKGAAMGSELPQFLPGGSMGDVTPEDVKEAAKWHAEAKQAGPDDCLAFVFRDLNMGMIVAVADEDPFQSAGPRDVLGWSWMLNSIGSHRLLWYRRHGLSACRENSHFWSFLIPGVGLPPITAFRVLITLFVLAIGPVNYLLLRRWKRLHLLVVTVPASAAAVTLALFAYAVVADGLATRVRVRSVTNIDQQRGQAACWSRLSFYAGLTPYGGLRFPDDAAVIPLEFRPQEDRARPQELLWRENQWLTRGWLPPRTPTQFVTVRSRPTKLHLAVNEPEDRLGSLQVENYLGTRIEQLLIRAKDGQYFWASDVEAGATARVVAIEASEARTRLRRTCQQRQPMGPAGMEDRQRALYRYGRYRRQYGVAYEEDVLPPSQWTSLLEGALADVQSARLEPGSYAAVVERSPEVVLGVDSPQEQASLHVIVGTW